MTSSNRKSVYVNGRNLLIVCWLINIQSDIIGKKITGVRHSDVLEVGTNTEICNKGLLGEGKIERFYPDRTYAEL